MKHGAGFGTDLNALYHAATIDLPEMTERPAKANMAIAGTSGDAGAFVRRGTIANTPYSGDVQGKVFPHWDRLRDALQAALAESVNNIYGAADALIGIANNYASFDVEAGDAMVGLNETMKAKWSKSDPSNQPNSDHSTYEDPGDRQRVENPT